MTIPSLSVCPAKPDVVWLPLGASRRFGTNFRLPDIRTKQIIFIFSIAAMDTEALAHCEKHVKFLLDNSPIYGFLFGPLKVTNVAPRGRVTARFTLEPQHLNSKGGLHGSVTATLVDFMGGVAIASTDLRDNTGVSVDMNISFLSLARVGDSVEVEGVVDKIGGSLAYTTITIRKVDGDKAEHPIVARGSHTKFVRQR